MGEFSKPLNLGFAAGIAPSIIIAFFFPSIAALGLIGLVAALVINKDRAVGLLREGSYMLVGALAAGGVIAGVSMAILGILIRPVLMAII